MGWSIEQHGSTVRVSIETPVGDWEALLNEVLAALDPPPAAVVLPREIPGASETDASLLANLWGVLAARRLGIQRGSDPEGPASSGHAAR